MQFQQTFERCQIPLFDAFLGNTPHQAHLNEDLQRPSDVLPTFSELSLRGQAGQCRHLLAPILRELSQSNDARWLTLVAPPASLTQAWLRDAGLNRERILVLHPRPEQNALDLIEHALTLGRSHTVISWLAHVERGTKQRLAKAASQGQAQSLNICLS